MYPTTGHAIGATEDEKGNLKSPFFGVVLVFVYSKGAVVRINAPGGGPNYPHGLSGVRSRSKILDYSKKNAIFAVFVA